MVIVPIYQTGLFQGNGILYKNLLISVAHIFKDKEGSSYSIIFKGRKVEVNLDSLLYFDYFENLEDINEVRKDLIIIKMPIKEMENTLIWTDPKNKDSIFLEGYNLDDSRNLQKYKFEGIVSHKNGFQSNGIKFISQNNVFDFTSNLYISGGFSGSPIYKLNIFYGLLSSFNYGFYSVIKASYIAQILKNKIIDTKSVLF